MTYVNFISLVAVVKVRGNARERRSWAPKNDYRAFLAPHRRYSRGNARTSAFRRSSLIKFVHGTLSRATEVLNPLALPADMSPEYGECEVKFLANKFGMAFQHVKHAFREYRDSYGASTPSAMLGLLNCVNTIPVSTAECERGFSKMNVICSSLRSRLTVPHTSSLMFLTLCGPPVQLWQPLKYVKAWLAKSRRGADSSHGLQ